MILLFEENGNGNKAVNLWGHIRLGSDGLEHKTGANLCTLQFTCLDRIY